MEKKSLHPSKIHLFQKKILDHWKASKRSLPWRNTTDPYKIFISELMLQQTQVSRVIEKYLKFIEKFPTIESIISAKDSEIIKLWKGLGYNKRALYAKKAMIYLVKHFDGKFPVNEKGLMKLPGVGEYTAKAILSFSFHKRVVLIDTNIRQVLKKEFSNGENTSDSMLKKIALLVMPKDKSWEWHQALMDYNALFLSKQKKKTINKREKIPFKNTNRFTRGKILDLLREKTYSFEKMYKIMKEVYDKNEDQVRMALDSLIKDKLIVKSKSSLSLP